MEANRFRYHKDWEFISKETRARTAHQCCLCEKQSTLTHHAAYINSKGELVGWDDIGILIFPLCQHCHFKAHHPNNWIVSRFGIMANRNTDNFILILQTNWQAISNI